MKPNRSWTFGVCVLAALLLLAAPSMAQISSSTGAIQGTVSDPGGAVIVGAKVVAVNVATGARTEGSSQSDGTYVFALLPPGTYRVEVESQGFRRTVLQGIHVEVTKVAVANASLEIGEIASEVLVSDSMQLVDTTSATTGDVIGGTLIRALPLPTRNFLDLTALQAGVAATMNNPAALGRGAPQLFVAGQRGTVNNFVLNGVDANNFSNNNFGNVPVPNPDAVQEFRVSTSQYDATQGRGSGGNINVLTRSGTSEYHGSAFWFYRDTSLNANDFFFNKTGTAKPVLHQNQLGGTIGGPLPGLQETFWFFSYQGMRQKNGVAGAVSGTQPVLPALRDAATLEATFGLAPGTADPVAVALLNQAGQYGGFLIPSGTCTGVPTCTGAGSSGLFTTSAPSSFSEDQYSATFDHQLLQSNKVAVRFFRANGDQFNPLGGGVQLGQGQANPTNATNVSVSDTHVFTSTLINEARVGYNLVRNQTTPTENVSLADIGMNRFNSSVFEGIPGIFFGGGAALSCCGINTNNHQASQTLSTTLADTLSWNWGKHSFRFGGEFRRYHVNLFNNFASRGAIQFNPTAAVGATPAFSAFQNFLRGAPVIVFIGSGVTDRGFRAYDVSGFMQDDYRIHPRLTLNLGLRYDIMSPSSDIRDRLGNFDPSLLSAACLQTGGNCLRDGFISPEGLAGGFGTPDVSKSTLVSNDLNNWAPRVGLAWNVFGNGKLAVRSGYGIYFIRTSNQTLLQLLTAAPFFQLANIGSTQPVIAPGTLANPFPVMPTPDQFPILPVFPQFNGYSAAGAPLFINPATGGPAALLTVNPFERDLRTPYNQNYNLTIQYEFLRNWTLDVGYIGARAVKLLASRNINAPRLVNAANPGLGGLTFNSSTNSTGRVMVPGFSSAGLLAVTGEGHSSFDALIVSVRHPFARGFEIKADYTFGKSIDNNSGAAAQDLGGSGGNQLALFLNRGLSLFDQKHRAVFTYLWEIPGPRSGWLGQVAGGWQISGVTIFQSGFPFNVTDSNGGSLQGAAGVSRANVVCNGPFTANGSVSSNVDSWVNPTCFAITPTLGNGTVLNNLAPTQAPGTQTFTIASQVPPGAPLATGTGSLFGDSGRGMLRGPFQQRIDFAVTKRFPLTRWLGEAGNLEFRAEFFKLFNTPIFANPANLSLGVPNAAGVPSNVANGTFGKITGTVDQTGRVIQMALKVNF